MTRLAERTEGRDNNYHLLRMVAALMVLASHSVAVATGDASREPLRLWLGVTPGTIAVDVFFVVSGLLVTQSMERHANAASFARARFLRIWPGLLVALLLTVFALGPWLTSLPVRDYLSAGQTWRYLLTNLTVFYRTAWDLPGLFTANPVPDAVNGSLWTLRHEVRCYAWLLLAWSAARLVPRQPQAFRWVCLVLVAITWSGHAASLTQSTVESSSWRLYAMFSAGSVAYLFRHQVPLSGPWWLAGVVALGLSTLDQRAFGYVYSLALPGLVIWLAYAPLGVLTAYNRMGDYSYGTYIYAFPIQQCLALLWPQCGLAGTAGVATVLTLVLAAASWHLVEKPAMALRPGGRRSCQK